MSDVRQRDSKGSDPERLPMAGFRGDIRRGRLGFGASYPFGHLEFDGERLRIWGWGASVEIRRADVVGVRLRPGVLATRVSVIDRAGTESGVYFAALSRTAVRRALDDRGWPVVEAQLPRGE